MENKNRENISCRVLEIFNKNVVVLLLQFKRHLIKVSLDYYQLPNFIKDTEVLPAYIHL